tara:strand:- start:6978 stop:7163 length:186 start_codon:yes stop_codon:yes gene_type:complete
MAATWIMNFLLMLMNFNTAVFPGDQVYPFDFNENGIIDSSDIVYMLRLQPMPVLNLTDVKK